MIAARHPHRQRGRGVLLPGHHVVHHHHSGHRAALRARHHDQHRSRRGRGPRTAGPDVPHSGQIALGLFALDIVPLGDARDPRDGRVDFVRAERGAGQKEGLDLKPREGRYFYGVIAAFMLIGLCLNLIGISARMMTVHKVET